MDAISAIVGVVEMVDPISHPSIAKDMTESFIVFSDQCCDFLIFFFVPWYFSVQPLIIGCPCDRAGLLQMQAYTQKEDSLVFIESEILFLPGSLS